MRTKDDTRIASNNLEALYPDAAVLNQQDWRTAQNIPWSKVAFSQQSQAAQDDYYPHHPSDCGYIKKLEIEGVSGYYFIQSCSRDDRMWLQEVKVTETKTRGVIYVQEQPLIDGQPLSPAYWCALQAPGFRSVGRSLRRVLTPLEVK
ncbi:hypothetical protein [Leptolyngbya sp. FACHB-17]|uniref:hypothetical protein n=1 Tax=unclassified Leptolyngbya TaxID=2650499 RepID=UPI00168134BD|nr:hypothetical protein [Leptolyngbya sp. FACHB-17]MBD2082691.1 hypothetical protein [Leptolyngbya sp. FACHB-17]